MQLNLNRGRWSAKPSEQTVITAMFGSSCVKAVDRGSRFHVYAGHLLMRATPDSALFQVALGRLDESTGWPRLGNNGLAGQLLSDWEPAHIFVAINLKKLEKIAKGQPANPIDPGLAMWKLMIWKNTGRLSID